MAKMKIDGRGLRKRSSTPNCFKSKARVAGAKARWADPVWREAALKRLADGRAKKKHGREGVPDGMRKADADKLWAEAEIKANEMIDEMKASGDLPEIVVPGSDDEKAEQALKEAYKIALGPMTHQGTKLTAIRTILEWTKSKPESKSKVTINKAEDWLNEVANDTSTEEGA